MRRGQVEVVGEDVTGTRFRSPCEILRRLYIPLPEKLGIGITGQGRLQDLSSLSFIVRGPEDPGRGPELLDTCRVRFVDLSRKRRH